MCYTGICFPLESVCNPGTALRVLWMPMFPLTWHRAWLTEGTWWFSWYNKDPSQYTEIIAKWLFMTQYKSEFSGNVLNYSTNARVGGTPSPSVHSSTTRSLSAHCRPVPTASWCEYSVLSLSHPYGLPNSLCSGAPWSGPACTPDSCPLLPQRLTLVQVTQQTSSLASTAAMTPSPTRSEAQSWGEGPTLSLAVFRHSVNSRIYAGVHFPSLYYTPPVKSRWDFFLLTRPSLTQNWEGQCFLEINMQRSEFRIGLLKLLGLSIELRFLPIKKTFSSITVI